LFKVTAEKFFFCPPCPINGLPVSSKASGAEEGLPSTLTGNPAGYQKPLSTPGWEASAKYGSVRVRERTRKKPVSLNWIRKRGKYTGLPHNCRRADDADQADQALRGLHRKYFSGQTSPESTRVNISSGGTYIVSVKGERNNVVRKVLIR
jgi:hypothetical protein